MTTFLQKCEEAAFARQYGREPAGVCMVDRNALKELVFQFKRLDEEIRSLHAQAEVKKLAEFNLDIAVSVFEGAACKQTYEMAEGVEAVLNYVGAKYSKNLELPCPTHPQ